MATFYIHSPDGLFLTSYYAVLSDSPFVDFVDDVISPVYVHVLRHANERVSKLRCCVNWRGEHVMPKGEPPSTHTTHM